MILAMNELQVGEVLDHYHIDALAAKSGMACIYRATDLQNGMPVAIKVPHFEVESDPLLFDRFKREDAIGRRLNHPRVMKVLGDEDRSRLYMVMEWLDGRKLRSVLAEENKLAPERATRIAIGICEALGYIHSQGRRAPGPETGKHHLGRERSGEVDRLRNCQ
jgi:eukaryotic-like serine/threonine-protein kinase